jgi:hypothetical protein
MKTFRTVLLFAIQNVLLIWGAAIIALTLILGRQTIAQLTYCYMIGGAFIALNFMVKAIKKTEHRTA